jgi:hypothetical protein
VLLQLEGDALPGDDAALGSLEGASDDRLLVASKLARAQVSQRRGDVEGELSELREVASLCGGRAAGRFFVRASAEHDGSPSVLSVSEEGWWWISHYADVLLRIGDAWVRRGAPSK